MTGINWGQKLTWVRVNLNAKLDTQRSFVNGHLFCDHCVESMASNSFKCQDLSRKTSGASFRAGESMKKSDLYHKWVEWSEKDQIYIGKCPDLITGIHGEDPVRLYSELCEVVEEVLQHFEMGGRSIPNPRIRPMQDVA